MEGRGGGGFSGGGACAASGSTPARLPRPFSAAAAKLAPTSLVFRRGEDPMGSTGLAGRPGNGGGGRGWPRGRPAEWPGPEWPPPPPPPAGPSGHPRPRLSSRPDRPLPAGHWPHSRAHGPRDRQWALRVAPDTRGGAGASLPEPCTCSTDGPGYSRPCPAPRPYSSRCQRGSSGSSPPTTAAHVLDSMSFQTLNITKR